MVPCWRGCQAALPQSSEMELTNTQSESGRVSKVSEAAKAESNMKMFKPQVLDARRFTQILVFFPTPHL